MQVTAKQTPLETLVMSQLVTLRQHEAALQLEFRSNAAGSANVASRLWELQRSADRLNRMIDAMSIVSPCWQSSTQEFAVA